MKAPDERASEKGLMNQCQRKISGIAPPAGRPLKNALVHSPASDLSDNHGARGSTRRLKRSVI
jgi:hypothetical protein